MNPYIDIPLKLRIWEILDYLGITPINLLIETLTKESLSEEPLSVDYILRLLKSMDKSKTITMKNGVLFTRKKK